MHAAFGEHFVKTGLIGSIFHRWLLDAFDMRVQADYGIDIVLTPEEVKDVIKQARQFLEECRRYLRTSGA